ncbi:MAG: phosphotransferase family protein [Mycobacterium kyogaense]|uniref:phosphotransferase family protein n=1 Tax=Mycobacterium kyogaense TaxID=2212479 RepID=UPI002FFAB4A2
MTTDRRMWQEPELVVQWLRAHGQNVSPPVSITRVGFGQSNITTLITDSASGEWVMREPPPGRAAATAHDIEREAQILRGLAASSIPVPVVVGTGTGPDGCPFVVMEKVPGAALEDEADALELIPDQRHALGVSVAETLGRLHRLDPSSLGLTPSRTPYLVRQIRRITEAWDRYADGSALDSDWAAVRSTLVTRLPPQPQPVIMHGDYRLSNLLVEAGAISAVLDWELCTIGDPMADVAWLLDDWRSPQEQRIVMPSPTRAGGFPSRDEMIEVYRDASGIDPIALGVYRAFTQWRAAGLLRGVLQRRRAGVMGSHGAVDPEELESTIESLLSSAQEHLVGAG